MTLVKTAEEATHATDAERQEGVSSEAEDTRHG